MGLASWCLHRSRPPHIVPLDPSAHTLSSARLGARALGLVLQCHRRVQQHRHHQGARDLDQHRALDGQQPVAGGEGAPDQQIPDQSGKRFSIF